MSFNHHLHRLCLLSSCFATSPVLVGAGGPDSPFEIEFEPMEIGDSSADPLLDMLKAVGPPPGRGEVVISSGRPSNRGHSKHGRESELDQMLGDMLGSMMQPLMQIQPQRRPRGLPMATHGRGSPFGEVVIEGPSGTQVMSLGGDDFSEDGPGKIPGDLFRDLFPGPLGMMQAAHPQPFSVPDPLMMNMLQDLDSSFARDMLPAIHKASSQERTPNSCEQDIKSKCQGAKSQLHCLGYNHDSISEPCRKDVEKSVPFLCTQAIDKWCDILETGILSCLYGHMDSLEGKCRDAVLTTKKVINKVNTQKAAVVDPVTGEKLMSIPEAKAEIDAMLDKRMSNFLAAHDPQAIAPGPASGWLCSPWPTATGSAQDRCMNGNSLNNGFEYLYNQGADMHTPGACGIAGCSCCLRPKAKSSQGDNPTQLEAHLDAKLGIASATQPKQPEASAPVAEAKAATTAPVQQALTAKSGEVRNANAASFISKPVPSDWSRSSAMHLVRWPLLAAGLVCMVVVGAYTCSLQDSTLLSKAVRTALVQQKAPEAMSLYNNNVELPRSVDA